MGATSVIERPILFSGPMVKAILDGRKTMTPRAIKPQPPKYIDELHGNDLRGRAPYPLEDYETGHALGVGFQDDNERCYRCPYGVPGERLWIKMGYRTLYDARYDHTHWSTDFAFITAHGRAMSKTGRPKKDGGHPGMFMPYWLSQELRLPVLEVTDVRVERLQEITEEDAQNEGFPGERWATGHGDYSEIAPSEQFRDLWNSINGKKPDCSWTANPWVWVVSFKKL